MKKIIILIIGILIGLTTGVYAAYKYQASEVGYKNTNVDAAINELYDKVNNGVEIHKAFGGQTYKGIVYLDPTDLTKKCNETNYIGSTTGTKVGCMKWYVFDDSGNKYKMILDHNTTATQVWNTSNVNVSYEQSSVKTVVDTLVSTNKWVVTPRLITVDEITKITNKQDFNGYYYFDSNNQNQVATSKGASKYSWLYDYTYNCVANGCNIEDSSTWGYWTSDTNGTSGEGKYVWIVQFHGLLSSDHANTANYYGIRPVIEVSKSIFK